MPKHESVPFPRHQIPQQFPVGPSRMLRNLLRIISRNPHPDPPTRYPRTRNLQGFRYTTYRNPMTAKKALLDLIPRETPREWRRRISVLISRPMQSGLIRAIVSALLQLLEGACYITITNHKFPIRIIEPRTPLCFRCFGFSHRLRNCSQLDLRGRCRRCASSEHRIDNCKDLNKYVACQRAGFSPYPHFPGFRFYKAKVKADGRYVRRRPIRCSFRLTLGGVIPLCL